VTYKPQRDSRFEYLWEIMEFIEEKQCNTCQFKSDREDFSMCDEIEAQIIAEEPVEDLDDAGSHGVVCTKYEQERPASDPNQLSLF